MTEFFRANQAEELLGLYEQAKRYVQSGDKSQKKNNQFHYSVRVRHEIAEALDGQRSLLEKLVMMLWTTQMKLGEVKDAKAVLEKELMEARRLGAFGRGGESAGDPPQSAWPKPGAGRRGAARGPVQPLKDIRNPHPSVCMRVEMKQGVELKSKRQAEQAVAGIVQEVRDKEAEEGKETEDPRKFIEDVSPVGRIEEGKPHVAQVVWSSQEKTAQWGKKIQAAGYEVAGAPLKRMKVWLHDVDRDATWEEVVACIDKELEAAGVEPTNKEAKKEELTHETKWKLEYRPNRQGEVRAEIKAVMFMSERVRWVLHNKCRGRVRTGGGLSGLKVEDAGGPMMCFKCCGFGHAAYACRAPRAKCAHCGGDHEMRACKLTDAQKADPGRLKCGRCQQRGHSAHESRKCVAAQSAWDTWHDTVFGFLGGPAPLW
uniref:CCHC-type domain-containing protein n=1 Tax=Heterosigma akashiwo TaxID=2829 RepID=A0A7S4DAM3_HETAK